MKLSIVVAAAEDNAIGKDNQLLWKLPNDMKFFKNLTWGMSVVMGRKTFESIGSKALPGRLNIVITRQPALYMHHEGVKVVSTIQEAINLTEKEGYKELFIIGGSDIYNQTVEMVDTIYLTKVHASFPTADTYFSAINPTAFALISEEKHEADEKHSYSYSFETWKRKN
jgi:dihydrofolate reductase